MPSGSLWRKSDSLGVGNCKLGPRFLSGAIVPLSRLVTDPLTALEKAVGALYAWFLLPVNGASVAMRISRFSLDGLLLRSNKHCGASPGLGVSKGSNLGLLGLLGLKIALPNSWPAFCPGGLVTF